MLADRPIVSRIPSLTTHHVPSSSSQKLDPMGRSQSDATMSPETHQRRATWNRASLCRSRDGFSLVSEEVVANDGLATREGSRIARRTYGMNRTSFGTKAAGGGSDHVQPAISGPTVSYGSTLKGSETWQPRHSERTSVPSRWS